MAVEMRERPVVFGKDAIKFLERTKKNNLAMNRKIVEAGIGKNENERQGIYRHLRASHQTY